MKFGEIGWLSIRMLHEMIAAASRAGANVIVDHLMMLDPPILQDCIWRLEDLPVLLVGLRPDQDVLVHRITSREIKFPADYLETVGPAAAERVAANSARLTPWYISAVNENSNLDLIVDSHANSPGEVCRKIRARLDEGPGQAFGKLRELYPKPF
jgi:chloramphenicol 3-O-phosphotransferase